MFTSTCNNLLRKSSQVLRLATRLVSTCEEIRIPVPWGHIAGKWWGPQDKRPILALHGWQDSCATFDRLTQHISEDIGVLAIDLPGHGLSSHLPPGIFYDIMSNSVLIKRLLDYFQWRKVSLLGHSLGAITCYTYSLLYPNSVDFLICLDEFQPHSPQNNPIEKCTKIVDDFLRYDALYNNEKEPPSYTIEQVTTKVFESLRNSVKIEHCHDLVQRNIRPSGTEPGKYYFSRDPRAKTFPMFLWGVKDIIDSAHKITCPVLFCKFSDSPYYDGRSLTDSVIAIIKTASEDFQFRIVPGSHHAHVNNPQDVAEVINSFIAKHDVEDRKTGSVQHEIEFK